MTAPVQPARVPAVASPFIVGLGLGQIISWGTLYYSFPLIAVPMAAELHLNPPEAYSAVTVGLLASAAAAYPVGAAIDRGHGRLVMTVGSLLAGGLLAAWSRADGLPLLLLVFAGLGVAQAMTLYEAGFAVIAHRHGGEARRWITALSLWGGFASTVFVPLIQGLIDTIGWRDTLLVLAVFNVGIAAALHWRITKPTGDPERRVHPDVAIIRAGAPLPGGWRAVIRAAAAPAFWGLLVAFTCYYCVFSALTFHLYPLLLERGFSTAAVVGAIALVGPAQVAGRVAVWLLAGERSIRGIGSVTVAVFPVALTLLLILPAGLPALALFALLYGATNGVMTIVRGLAVPEMVTGDAYGAVNAAIALPATMAKALAPVAAAALWVAAGSYDGLLIWALAGFLASAVGFWFAALQPLAKRSRSDG